MKTLEVIEPLSPKESAEYERLEEQREKAEKHVAKWIDAVRGIRDGRLYRAEFSTFAAYCEKKLNKTVRAVQLAFQMEEAKKDAISSSHCSDEQTRALVEGASGNALQKLAKVPKDKRGEVFKRAAKQTGGKITAKSVSKAASQLGHTKFDSNGRLKPQGGFQNDNTLGPLEHGKRTDFNAYTGEPKSTSPPVKTTAVKTEESHKSLPEIDAESAALAKRRLRAFYELHKGWFNAIVQGAPRKPIDIVDRLLEEGLKE